MASSIQKVRDKVESFDDMDLLVLLGFLVESLETKPDSYSVLRKYRVFLESARNESGPGTIDLELDQVAMHPAARDQFERLLSEIERKLAAFGEVISSAILNTQYRVRGVRFADFETSRLRAAILKLRSLVRNVQA